MYKGAIHSYVTEVNRADSSPEIKSKFIKRIEEGKLSLKENPKSHLTVSFAAYDPRKKLVFVGLHKRSGLWMFNGGHVKQNELLGEALKREVREEWGSDSFLETVDKPSLLTITPVINPGDRACELHYGIWYFIPVDSDKFDPFPEILEKEYIEVEWKTAEEANKLIVVPNYLLVLKEIGKKF